jgi:hypothetical protein
MHDAIETFTGQTLTANRSGSYKPYRQCHKRETTPAHRDTSELDRSMRHDEATVALFPAMNRPPDTVRVVTRESMMRHSH